MTGLSLDFTVFSQTFTEADDVDVPDFPVLAFQDGDIYALDFLVIDSDCTYCGGTNVTDIAQPGVFQVSLYDIYAASAGG